MADRGSSTLPSASRWAYLVRFFAGRSGDVSCSIRDIVGADGWFVDDSERGAQKALASLEGTRPDLSGGAPSKSTQRRNERWQKDALDQSRSLGRAATAPYSKSRDNHGRCVILSGARDASASRAQSTDRQSKDAAHPIESSVLGYLQATFSVVR